MARRHTNNRMQGKQNNFGAKYGNQDNITKKAEWISNMEKELEGLEKGPKVKIQIDSLRTTLKKISNWKTPIYDGIHGFWLKKTPSIHDRLAIEMNRCLEGDIPEWVTKAKTTLIWKYSLNGITPNNYRPMTCLPMMWKILMPQIREEIYDSLISHGLRGPEAKETSLHWSTHP